jgi:hypothetical protein
MNQQGREITPITAEPSPLWFVTSRLPRVEVLRSSPGGFNLLTNPKFDLDANADGFIDGWIGYQSGPEAVTYTVQPLDGVDGGRHQRVAWVGNNTGAKGIGKNSSAVVGGWQQNQWYTISFYARASGTSIGQVVRLDWNTSPNSAVTIAQPTLTANWQRYVFKVMWIATVPNNQIYITLQINSGTAGYLEIDQVQAETGEQATEFAPQLGETVVGVAGELEFSLDGRTGWQTSRIMPLSGALFARYTPQAPTLTADGVKALSFTINGVAHHCEALHLLNVPTPQRYEEDVLFAMPSVYRTGNLSSEALIAVVKTLAWLTYPLRLITQRPEILLDGRYCPSHLLEDTAKLLGLPTMQGLPVAARRALVANSATYFEQGGSYTQLKAILELYIGQPTEIYSVDPYAIVANTEPFAAVEAARENFRYWAPAWIAWQLYDGYFSDGAYFADGALAADGKPYP